MKKIEYDITPIGMLNNANSWYVLYRQNINYERQRIVAVYCLLISLEMYLKAYLIYLNMEKYSLDVNLRNLGHEFKEILTAIKNEEKAKLLTVINSLINKYNLASIDTNNLRYPRKGDRFLLYGEYLKPINEFDDIINVINSEISKGVVDKFYES